MSETTATPMLTQAEAAAILHVTPRSMRNFVARGLLPAYRIKGTRSVRFELADVEAMKQRIPVTDGVA